MPETAHAVLALILALMLGYQVWVFAGLLGSRRALATKRQLRITELVWVAIPVAVVLFLAARSWIVAFDLAPSAVAAVASVEVSTPPPSPPIIHR